MKKKNTLVVAFCMALAVSACAAGCAGGTGDTPETHEHNYAAAWSSDESYHWHACTSTTGTCDAPQNSKAEHSWDNGVITQEATAEADGVKTFTCTVCSKNKTESVEYVAPIHEHDYAVAWSSDESYHWHACTSTTGTCDAPQNSKAEHSWDNGVITQEATAEADGVKTFTCTVCSKNKTESVEYVAPEFELKENTDFAVLVSEQVTEEEWKTAFEITNVTIKLHDNIYSDNADMLFKRSGSELYVGMGSSVEYYNKLADGTLVELYRGQTVSVAPDNANYQSILEGYYKALKRRSYPDFSEFYSSFTYDSAKGAYVLNETVRTNCVPEGWDVDYNFAELKIINGKLAYVRCGNYEEGTTTALNDQTEYFYDFGTTEITLPTIELKENTDFAALVSEQVTEEEWKTAFEITNVTIKVHDNIYNDDPDHLIEINGSEVIMSDAGNPNISYMNKLADGTIECSNGDAKQSFAPNDANYESILEAYNYSLTWNYPDFSEFYSSFTYDSAKGAYVLNETVRTNSVLEGWDSDYDFAELKIINGKLAYVRWGNYGEGTTALNDKTEYFYDFGTTEITLPTA